MTTARELTVAAVAATHAAALDAQMNLLGTINGWPVRPSSSAAWRWVRDALQARAVSARGGDADR